MHTHTHLYARHMIRQRLKRAPCTVWPPYAPHPAACLHSSPPRPLPLIQRIAQSTEGTDDLRNAVDAMDLVSKKLLDALGLEREGEGGGERESSSMLKVLLQCLICSACVRGGGRGGGEGE